MNNTNSNYIELSKAKIQDTRNIVISSNESKGGYTMAQQISIIEGERETLIFMKNAIHIDDIDGLYNLRDAINEAIKAEENN